MAPSPRPDAGAPGTRRTALVTGASAGLGAEFARQYAARGVDLVLVARREQRLQALAATLTATHGVRVSTIAADLADASAPAAIHARVGELGVDIDCLVNNAGAAGPDLLSERDWQQHARYLELMLVSVVRLCHLFVPPMRARGFGRVVNVASVAGRVARASDLLYGPSKAFVIAFSEALALSAAADGVHVCALCPGFTHTEFHDAPPLQVRKARSPAFLWYPAATVVREGLAAVERGDSVCISGRLYRWLDPLLTSRLTRRLANRIASRRF